MQRFERIIIYLSLISVGLLPFAFASTWIGGLRLSPTPCLLGLGLYLLILRSLHIKKIMRYPKLVVWSSLGFASALMLSIIGRPNPHWQEVTAFIFYLTIPFLMSSIIRDFTSLKKAIWILILAGFAFALIGNYRFLTKQSPWFEIVDHYKSFGTRNSDVFMLEGAFILALSFYVLGKPLSRFIRLLHFFALVLMGIGIVFSFSRGAWVSTFVGFLILFILASRARYMARRFTKAKYALRLGGFLLMLILLVTSVFSAEDVHKIYSRLLTLTAAEPAQISPSRWFQLKSSWIMICNSPIRGIGVGNFAEYIIGPPFNSPVPWSDPHNSYLHALVEEGIVGILVMIALVLSPIIYLKRLLRVLRTKEDAWMLFGLLAVMIVYSVHLLFTAFFNFIFFWIIYGLATAAITCAWRELRNDRTVTEQGRYKGLDYSFPDADEGRPWWVANC